MSDLDDRLVAVRVLVPALTSIVVIPAALLHVYLLVLFLPEATGYSCEGVEPPCRYEVVDTVYWWLLLGIVVVAVVGLGLTWWRQWHPGRWWRWPVLALAPAALGFVVAPLLAG